MPHSLINPLQGEWTSYLTESCYECAFCLLSVRRKTHWNNTSISTEILKNKKVHHAITQIDLSFVYCVFCLFWVNESRKVRV